MSHAADRSVPRRRVPHPDLCGTGLCAGRMYDYARPIRPAPADVGGKSLLHTGWSAQPARDRLSALASALDPTLRLLTG